MRVVNSGIAVPIKNGINGASAFPQGQRVCVRTGVVPTGLAHLFHFTRHFRAGLSPAAATRLEFRWCLFHRLPSTVVLTRSLKPTSLFASDAALKNRSSTRIAAKAESSPDLNGASQATPFQDCSRDRF